MLLVQCSACGSKELELHDGMLICVYCRSRHLPSSDSGQNFDAFEKKLGLDLVLEDGGAQKIAVIKEVRALTNMGLKEAKDLVESAPQVVLRNISLDEANMAKRALEDSGARVSII